MSKKPSDATLLRHARRDINNLKAMQAALITERDRYRERATKAEQESAEWKRRFDILLVRTPQLEPPHSDLRMQRCIDLLRQNLSENYISAIKLHRELFGSSLVDAKKAMDVERDKLRLAHNG